MDGYKITDKILQEYNLPNTYQTKTQDPQSREAELEIARFQGKIEAIKKFKKEFNEEDRQLRLKSKEAADKAARDILASQDKLKIQIDRLKELENERKSISIWFNNEKRKTNSKNITATKELKHKFQREVSINRKRLEIETKKAELLKQQYLKAISQKSAWEAGMKNALIASALIGTGILASYVYSKLKVRWKMWKDAKQSKSPTKTKSPIEDNIFQMQALVQAEKELNSVASAFNNDEDIVRRTETVKNQIQDKKIKLQQKMREHNPDQLRHYTYYN